MLGWSDSPYWFFLLGGYLVLYVNTGQGTARGLDNPAELPLADAVVPCHKLDSLNTRADLPKKKKKAAVVLWVNLTSCSDSYLPTLK